MNLLPFPDDAPLNLLIGYSGGRDSIALLHRLVAWCADNGRTLRAVHVDHGLHPDSAQWAQHCVTEAGLRGVPLAVHRAEVRRDGRGLEAAARTARYAAFAAERRKDECLVLAHHRDDQAETLLLALLRGSGERGLSAMRPFVNDARGPIWRPWIETPGDVIARYADEQALRWIEDPANHDLRLSRNALRHEVLPALRRRWPQADAALARSAAVLAEADVLLDAEARRDLAPLLRLDARALDLSGLQALPAARGRRVLRAWAAMHDIEIGRDAIARVAGDWHGQPPARALRHALGTLWLRQWQGKLWLTPRGPVWRGREPPSPRPPALDWDGTQPLDLPHGGTLSLRGTTGFHALPSVFTPPLRVGARHEARGGMRMTARRPARGLQQAFADLGVPPWQRALLPLLIDAGGQVLAIADLAYAADFDTWLGERNARLLWQPVAAAG